MTNVMRTFVRFVAVSLATCTLVHAQVDAEIILSPGTPDEFPIPLLDGTPVRVDPDSGNILASPADPQICSGSGNCSDVTVLVQEFIPTPATIEQGASFQATLQSTGAWQCSRSGLPGTSWNAASTSPPSDGTINVNVGTSVDPAIYTLRYDCENGPVTDFATATIEVVAAETEPDPTLPAECDGLPLPTEWTRDTTAMAASSITRTETWFDVFENAFPLGASENLAHNRDQYIALEFDPSGLPDSAEGAISFNTFTTGITGIGNGTPTVSLSRCPGDFRTQDDSACRRIDGAQLIWSAEADPAEPGCQIDTSQSRYFLNIVYAWELEDDDPATWSYFCVGGEDECGSLVTSSSNQ